MYRDEAAKKDLIAPVLIERKSIQDVAGSLADGRWESQKKGMREGQQVFGDDSHLLSSSVSGLDVFGSFGFTVFAFQAAGGRTQGLG